MSKYIKSIGLMIFIVILSRIDYSDFFTTLRKINYFYLAISFLFILPILATKAYRWQHLLKAQNITCPFNRSFSIYMKGFFLGLITPGRIGEFSKASYLKSITGIPLSKSAPSVLFDRSLDLLFLITIGSLGLSVYFKSNVGFWVLILCLLFFIASLMLIRFHKNIIRLLRPRIHENNYDRISVFIHGLKKLTSPQIVFALLLSIIAYLLFYTQCYFLALAVNLNLSLQFIIFSVSTASLASLLPISILGIGTRDTVFILAFGTIGINAEKALSYSLMLFMINYIGGGLIGLIAWLRVKN